MNILFLGWDLNVTLIQCRCVVSNLGAVNYLEDSNLLKHDWAIFPYFTVPQACAVFSWQVIELNTYQFRAFKATNASRQNPARNLNTINALKEIANLQ